MRTLEYYDTDLDEWFEAEWSTVVSGMRVKLYEEDGTPISDGTGIYEMDVVSDAYQQTISGEEGIWTINILDPEPYIVAKREGD